MCSKGLESVIASIESSIAEAESTHGGAEEWVAESLKLAKQALSITENAKFSVDGEDVVLQVIREGGSRDFVGTAIRLLNFYMQWHVD